MDFNESLKELDALLQNETEKKNKAKEAAEKAEKIKREAEIEARKAEEAERILKDAKERMQRSNDVYNAGSVKQENKNNKNTSNNSTVKPNKYVTWLATAALVFSLGSCGLNLVKESKTGTIKNTTASVTDTDENSFSNFFKRLFGGDTKVYHYNYGDNVVTVNDGDNTVFTTSGLANSEYVPLTQEAFEQLCANAIKKIEDLGIAASHEDIIKFVTVYNINKMRQDCPELAKKVMGTQTVLEVFDDAALVGDTLMSYEAQNLIYNGQILSVADFVFDKEQQKLIRDFEAQKLAIIQANAGDRENMTYEWLYSLIDAQSEFRLFDNASRLLVLRHCVVPIDSVYFKDSTFHSTLTGSARMLMFQMIAPYGSTEEEIKASVASSTEKNMMDTFNQCIEMENNKTLTRR